MVHHPDEKVDDMNLSETDAQFLDQLLHRLGVLEGKIERLTTTDYMNSTLSAVSIQEITTKISTLRDLIDKIEMELEQMNSRLSDIELLRFKYRSES
jgi:uncharacterized small protein (DUF1192 family)